MWGTQHHLPEEAPGGRRGAARRRAPVPPTSPSRRSARGGKTAWARRRIGPRRARPVPEFHIASHLGRQACIARSHPASAYRVQSIAGAGPRSGPSPNSSRRRAGAQPESSCKEQCAASSEGCSQSAHGVPAARRLSGSVVWGRGGACTDFRCERRLCIRRAHITFASPLPPLPPYILPFLSGFNSS